MIIVIAHKRISKANQEPKNHQQNHANKRKLIILIIWWIGRSNFRCVVPIWSHWCCCYLFFHFEQRPTMTTTMLSSSSIRISWFWSIIYLCSFRFFLVRIHFVQFDWFGCFLFACCLFRLLGLVFFLLL